MNRIKYTTTDFIKKARIIHGDLYNYDKSEYKGRNHKLIIICKTHGEFQQRAGHHLQGQGCRLCGLDQMSYKIMQWTPEMDKLLIENYKEKGANFCKNKLKKSLHSIYHRAQILGLKKNNDKLNSPFISGRMWSNIICNAKIRNLELSITPDDIYKKYIEQNKKCALSGDELLLSNDICINEASVDRIDSRIGYIKGNIQLVHKKINQMKMDLSENEFFDLSKKIYHNLKHLYEREPTIQRSSLTH